MQPWSADEALSFLRAAKSDPLYPAFALLLLYGMRRGEVLGLRWQDVDLDAGRLRIRQQIGRVSGELRTGPVKTRAGNRDLPIPTQARSALLTRQEQQAAGREAFGRGWQDTGLVSALAAADLSSPGTWSPASAGSATTTSSGRSRSITFGTQLRRS